MDGPKFDDFARTLAAGTSRRRLLGGLAGGVIGGILGAGRHTATATDDDDDHGCASVADCRPLLHGCLQPTSCVSGRCRYAPKDCGDGNPCTLDICNPLTGACLHPPLRNGRPCNDGNACTSGDVCRAGVCVGTPRNCDDGNGCTVDTCDPATGQCINIPKNCNDDNACTEDFCDPETGQCIHNPKTCDDDNACTEDSCDPETGECVYTEINCDDGIACTHDSCDPATGECVHTPDDSLCSPPNPCFVAICDPTQGCIDVPIDCNDGDPCTTDTCVGGQCVHTPHNLCNDNLRCTDDFCVPTGPDTFTCDHVFDPDNCGTLSSCQTAMCGIDQDCVIVNNDDLCPASFVSCLAPKCSALGCSFIDTCTPSNPQCNGCAQCTCSSAQNKCVPSCPA